MNPEVLLRRLNREIAARKEAEALLEKKALDLYLANQELHALNQNLEQQVRDRTDRLRQSEEKYRGIIENMELGLLEVDNKGIIVRPNGRFCEMVGYEEEELIGKDPIQMFVPPEFVRVLDEQHSDRRDGKAGVYEVQIIKRDGSRIWVLISGAPIYEGDGNMAGSLGIHYDITARKQLEQNLQIAKRQAEEAQESEKLFLANMSHEIRTPLNAIIGMAHLLYDTNPSEEQKEYLNLLRSSADMLHNLISDILDLSKVRAGKLEAHAKVFDVAGLVRSVYRTFKLRLEDRPIELTCYIDPQIDMLVEGDDLLLNQALLNLLGNAIKFTEQGRIDIQLVVLNQEKDHIELQFSIADTGIGIPDDQLEAIFQNFRQVDGDIKRKYGGTGLGLAITKQIIEIQGGSIKVHSKLGKGSRFTFNLTYRDTGQAIGEARSVTLPGFVNQVRQHRILVVEDNHMNRKYIGSLLEKWKITYDFAHNGREGVEKARRQAYTLIFMDIQMPEMDGYEATIAIRNERNPNSNTPIVALTASAMLSNKDKAFQVGMTDYVSKPFNPQQIFEKLQKFHSEPEEPVENDSKEVENVFLSAFDTAVIAEHYGDDMAYAADMFGTFLLDIVPQFDLLRSHLDSRDWPNVARVAHKIKPAFTMIGLPAFTDRLADVEAAAQKTDIPDSLEADLRTLLSEIEHITPVITQQHQRLQEITA